MKMKTAWIIMVVVMVGMFAVSACSKAPLFEKNWHKVKVGMTKGQVVTLLGEPTIKNDSAKVEVKSEGDSEPLIATVAGIGFAFIGTPDESWEYLSQEEQPQTEEEKFRELVQALSGPRDESYVVYFDSAGQVKKKRDPVEGHQSDSLSCDFTEDHADGDCNSKMP